MKPLKVKILGGGNAAAKHARAFAELSELYQIVDSDDYDIVDLCTPNSLHYKQAMRAFTESKCTFVEKPICGSLEEIDDLIRFTVHTPYHVFPIFQYRFVPHDNIGNQIVTQWKRDVSYHDGWRGDWTKALGGALTSHGIHLIDIAIKGFGMPKIVTAGMDTHLGPERFADVFMGEPGNMIRVATFIHPDVRQGGFSNFNLGNSHDGYVEQFRRIHASITDGAPAPVTLAEARQSLEVLTAAYWSAYTGEPATLPILPEHPFYRGWASAFAERSRSHETRSQTRS